MKKYLCVFRKQGENAAPLSQEVKAKLETKVTQLVAVTHNFLCSPQSRTLFLVAIMILVSATNSFAAKELKEVVNDFSKFIYEDVRFAICILGLAYAGVKFWSKDDNGRTQAFYIMIGVGIFAFGPGIIEYIATLTDTTRPDPSVN